MFDDIITKRLGDSLKTPTTIKQPDFVAYEGDSEPDIPFVHTFDEDPVDASGKAAFEKPLTDVWINVEVSLP